MLAGAIRSDRAVKPAHVGEPDRRRDRLGVAAPDLAVEDQLAGMRADIGVEQVPRVRRSA